MVEDGIPNWVPPRVRDRLLATLAPAIVQVGFEDEDRRLGLRAMASWQSPSGLVYRFSVRSKRTLAVLSMDEAEWDRIAEVAVQKLGEPLSLARSRAHGTAAAAE